MRGNGTSSLSYQKEMLAPLGAYLHRLTNEGLLQYFCYMFSVVHKMYRGTPIVNSGVGGGGGRGGLQTTPFLRSEGVVTRFR